METEQKISEDTARWISLDRRSSLYGIVVAKDGAAALKIRHGTHDRVTFHRAVFQNETEARIATFPSRASRKTVWRSPLLRYLNLFNTDIPYSSVPTF